MVEPRTVSRWLARLLVLGGAAAIAVRVAEPHAPSPVPQAAAFVPWALPVWALGLVLALVGRARVVPLVAVAGLVVQLWWTVPPARGQHAPSGGAPLTLMTQNARFGLADADRIVALVRQQRVDVLVVEELTPALVERLGAAGLGQVLPYDDLSAEPGASGTGIWARWPLRPDGAVPDTGFAMPRAVVAVPGTAGVSVTGVHTRAPRPGNVPGWRADLAAVARAGPDQSTPAIVTGDFNASRDHSGFRAVLAAGYTDAEDVHPWWRARPGFTWPADRAWPPLTRIDHVLVTVRTIGVREVRVVRVGGTDHRGVVVRLSVSDR